MGSIKNRIAAFESNQAATQAAPSIPSSSPPDSISSQPTISLQALTEGSVQAAARHRAFSTSSFASSNATALQPGADVFGKPNGRSTDSVLDRGRPSPVKRTISATSSGSQDLTLDRSRSPVKMALNGQQAGFRSSAHSSPRLGSSEILSLYSTDSLSPTTPRFNLPASPSGSFSSLPSKSSPDVLKSNVPLPASTANRSAPPALAPKPANLKSSTPTTALPSSQVEGAATNPSALHTVQPSSVVRPAVKDPPPTLPNRKPSLPPRSSTTGSSKETPVADFQLMGLRDEPSTSRPVPTSYRKPPPSIQSPSSSPSSVRSVLSNLSQPPPLPARKPTLPTPLPLGSSGSFSTSSTITSSTSTTRRAPPPPPLPLSSSKQGPLTPGASSSSFPSPYISPNKTQRGPRAIYYKSSPSTSSSSLAGSSAEREEVAKERYSKLFTKLIELQKAGRMRAVPEKKDSAQQGWRRPGVVKTDQERENEDQIDREGEGRLVGAVVKGIWEKSRLEKESLQRIWDQADPHKQGSLSREGFVTGMRLIDLELGRRRSSQRPGEVIRRDRRAL